MELLLDLQKLPKPPHPFAGSGKSFVGSEYYGDKLISMALTDITDVHISLKPAKPKTSRSA